MGIVPLQFLPGQNADNLGLTGRELYTIELPAKLEPGIEIAVKVTDEQGATKSFNAKLRFDTEVELTYFRHGGILHYMLRKLAKGSA